MWGYDDFINGDAAVFFGDGAVLKVSDNGEFVYEICGD